MTTMNIKTVLVLVFGFCCTLRSINCQYDDAPEIEDFGPKLKDGDSFDFIVVGSGSGGGVVGSRLSENPDWNVLVLEAGGDPAAYEKFPGFSSYIITSEEEWRPRSEPSETYCQASVNKRCQLVAGRVYGGGSTVANMVYQRGNPKNFQEWVEEGNDGWDWDTVLEYYKKSENNTDYWQNSKYHGKDGPMVVTKDNYKYKEYTKDLIKAANDMGIREFEDLYDGTGYTGIGDVQMLHDGKRKSSIFEGFLKPASKRNNFKLAGKAFVTKVLLDDGPKAIGVEVILNGKAINVFANKEVIVSGGPLSSPKILMLSGIGPKEDLEKVGISVVNDLPVGKNLQDHLAVWGLFIQFDDNDAIPPEELLKMPDIKEYKNLTGDSGGGGLGIVDVISTKNEEYPNIQIANFYESKFNKEVGILKWGRGLGLEDKILDFYIQMVKKGSYVHPVPFLFNPKSKGYVTLKSSDPLDPPSITMNYLSEQEDIDTLTEAINVVEKLYTHPKLAKHNPKFVTIDLPNPDNYEYKSPEYWEYHMRNMGLTMFHYAGTCKMGPANDETAVVDNRLRVHGVEGLRVIDASIMPNTVSGNILMTVVMIGEKGADMIKEDFGYSE